MKHTRRILTAAAASAALLAPLATIAAATPAQPAPQLVNLDDFSTDPAYARFYQQTIEWSADLCAGHVPDRPDRSYECATIDAPLDWHDPSKGGIKVGIGRILEYGDWSPGNNRRLLLSNPGGPGANGLNYGAVINMFMGLGESHNSVGIDPRGVGLSTNLICPEPPTDVPGTSWADGDSRVFTPATIAKNNEFYYHNMQACLTDQAGLVEYINSEQTARDVNFVRTLLGYDQADFFGTSYGSWLGAVTEKMFPNSFDRVLLDANFDWHSGSLHGAFSHQVQAFQATFDKQFLPFVGRHHKEYGLGHSAYAVNGTVNSLRAAVKAGKFGDDITADMFDTSLTSSMYNQYYFDGLARQLMAMKTVLGGDDTALPQIRATLLAAGQYSPTMRSVFQVVPCADTPLATAPENLYRKNEANARNLPLMGHVMLSNMCNGWTPQPALNKEFFHRPVGDVLMLQNEGDPATGYAGAWNARVRSPGNVKMLTIDDLPGHGLPFLENECAWNHTVEYMRDGNLPRHDVHCQAGPITAGPVADTAVYEFGRRASAAQPRPRPYFYGMRMLQEPVKDNAATAAFTGSASNYRQRTNIFPGDVAEVRDATNPNGWSAAAHQ